MISSLLSALPPLHRQWLCIDAARFRNAGEAVAFELRDCEGRTAVTVEAAAADNERRLVVGADAAEWSADGSITYLSDYLLIQRRDRDDGETPRDVWVRVVDGDPSAPVYPY